ncbi:MAG TPA: glycosyltransferase [Pirellulales bacterium]|jgi:glycosyltransferase involved in cell wall biosynthesis
MQSTTIIVPCHNEAKRLQSRELLSFASQHREISFLMVNDGSGDNTQEMLEELAAANPSQFTVKHLAQNCGKAEAVRRGILQAARQQPDYMGFWDADLATPLDAILLFSAVFERRPEISLVIGCRLPLAGHEIRRQRLRAWLGRRFLTAAGLVLGHRFYDTQCGAKLFRAIPSVLAAFSQPFHSRWIFDVELLARLRQLNEHQSRPALQQFVYELPLDSWVDVAGTKLKRSDFVKAFAELWAIWWRYRRPGADRFVPAREFLDLATESPPPIKKKAA